MYKRDEVTLGDILKKTKEDLEFKKVKYSYDWLGRSLAFNNYPPRDITTLFNKKEASFIPTIRFVDKKLQDVNFDPLFTAQEYEKKGALLLNIVTEPNFFKGDVEYLTAIRRYAPTPLISDDFIIDEYQVLESVVYGADCLILKSWVLDRKRLKELYDFSRRLGCEPIVEIKSKEDLIKAIFIGALVLCINNEDLQGRCETKESYERLISLIPQGKIIALKSGFSSFDDFKSGDFEGIDACFIYEDKG